jgi:hypothetical protein
MAGSAGWITPSPCDGFMVRRVDSIIASPDIGQGKLR